VRSKLLSILGQEDSQVSAVRPSPPCQSLRLRSCLWVTRALLCYEARALCFQDKNDKLCHPAHVAMVAAVTDRHSHPLSAQFAVLLALVFAKIARTDYPKHWPSLMDDLLAVMGEGDGLRRRRAYLVLHHVLKELSSKRLAADQRTFAEVWTPRAADDEAPSESQCVL